MKVAIATWYGRQVYSICHNKRVVCARLHCLVTRPRWVILQRKVDEELEELWEVDRYLTALKAERGLLDTHVRPPLSRRSSQVEVAFNMSLFHCQKTLVQGMQVVPAGCAGDPCQGTMV